MDRINFSPPLLNASGSLGYAPKVENQKTHSFLGAFVTKPLSMRPRTPARGQRLARVPSGTLLHSGQPNPGLSAVLQTYGKRWAESPLPIIAHVMGGSNDPVGPMIERLEMQENVTAVELGLPWDISIHEAAQCTRDALGELPLVVQLPLARAYDLAGAVVDAGAQAVSLGPPRGASPREEGGLLSGRLYGPAVFPLALHMVEALTHDGYPVIGAGGVFSRANATAMLKAGAIAVQLDTILWRENAQALFESFNE